LKFTIYSDDSSGQVVYAQTATVGSGGWESYPYWVGPMVSGVGLYSRACFQGGACTSWWPSPPPNPQPVSPAPALDPNWNWAGYAVTGGVYTEVGAYWVVPKAAGSGDRQMAAWVGLGGAQPSCCLEQIGTVSDTIDGKPSYKAFYQIQPFKPVFPVSNYPVHAGDIMEGIVARHGDTYTLKLYDLGPHGRQLWYLPFTVTGSNLDKTSAEVIAEDPTLTNGDFATLTEFGTVTFYDVFFNSEPATSFKLMKCTLLNGEIGVSGMNTATDGFTVTYNHS
jgi:hypothetical protein